MTQRNTSHDDLQAGRGGEKTFILFPSMDMEIKSSTGVQVNQMNEIRYLTLSRMRCYLFTGDSYVLQSDLARPE